MRFRRRVSRACTAFTAVLLAGTAAGCTGGAPGKTPGTDATRSLTGVGPITLANGKDSSGVLQGLLDIWNKDHPDQKVTLYELPAEADGQRQQLIQNAQTRSDAYSVIALDVVWTPEFAAHDWVEPLPESSFPVDEYLPSVRDATKYFGKMYTAPLGAGTGLLFYRTDLLGKADVPVPTTWDQMKAACDKVLRLPEAKGVSCYGGQFNKYEGLTVNVSELINSAGGQIVNAKGEPTLDTEAARKGLSFLVSSFANGTIPKPAISWDEEASRRAFQSGKLLFLRNWSYVWSLANATDGSSDVAGKVGVAPIPGLNGPGQGTVGMNALAISSFARNKKTALDFIRWMTSKEIERQVLVKTANEPAYAALFDDPDLNLTLPFLSEEKKGLQNARPRPAIVHYGDATTAIQEEVTAALSGQKTTEQALKDLQAKLADIIARK